MPPEHAAKSLVAEAMDANGPAAFEADGFDGARYIGAVAGQLSPGNRFEGDSLVDLAPFIHDGRLTWQPPRGKWRVVRFTHKQAPGLGQRGGKELSVDGASRESTKWFIETVYQPHHDRFKDDFGTTIPGFFYDEPETMGDWGTELNVILDGWGVDWKKAYVAYKFQLAGDDDAAARYQYMEAIAEAWGRVMYGGMGGIDVFLLCNQDHLRAAKSFELKFKAEGHPEIWDPMRNEIRSVPFTRTGDHVVLSLTLEPMESVLVVFNKTHRPLPPRLTPDDLTSVSNHSHPYRCGWP